MSNETYQTQALRLAERLTKHGIILPPTDILDTVASLHGQKNWAALRQGRERTIAAWLRKRLIGEPDREHVLTAEQLLHQMVPSQLQLGVSRDRKRIIAMENHWLFRHMAIIGQNGVGATTMMESLIAQQILRGGGLLFIDPWQDKALIDTCAAYAGRTSDVEVLDLGRPSARESLYAQKISYVDFRWSEHNPSRPVHELFDAFWAEASLLLARGERFEVPYMVVVPEAGVFMDTQWQMRYGFARAVGISIITHTQGIPTLMRANQAVADIILENSFTKVFFRQPSAASLDAAIRCIEATGPVNPEDRSIRERLVSLLMGEMLVSGYELLEDANCFLMKFDRPPQKPLGLPKSAAARDAAASQQG